MSAFYYPISTHAFVCFEDYGESWDVGLQQIPILIVYGIDDGLSSSPFLFREHPTNASGGRFTAAKEMNTWRSLSKTKRDL
jgi:hypothetical protein